jgi:hypothetical protein
MSEKRPEARNAKAFPGIDVGAQRDFSDLITGVVSKYNTYTVCTLT